MRRIFCFLFLSCLSALFVNAQNSDEGIITDEIGKKLHNESFTPSETLINNIQTPSLQIGGYAMLLYQYDAVKNIHDVRPSVAFLQIKGNLGTKFRYYLLSEFVRPQLYEYYGEWIFSPAFNLRVGQYRIPFTLENLISQTMLESIQNTRTVASFAGRSSDVGVSKSGRDIGIMASGSFLKMNDINFLHYWVGCFQGTGMNTPENNKQKDFSGILAVQPVKGLRFAGNLYRGTALYAIDENAAPTNNKRNRWGLSADYQSDRFYARAEWLNGTDADTKKSGIYGTALWYFIPEKLNLFGKIDHFSIDKSTNTTATDYIIGGSYYFYRNCRLQLNYVYSQYSKTWTGNAVENGVFAQMQVVF